MRLVEVVQVDDEVSLGRTVETEVAEVRVTADHRHDAGGGQVGDIVRHDDGGPAQEPIRRGRHPPDPNRDQPLQPAPMRLVDQLHWVGPVGAYLPFPERATRNLLPELLAHPVAVLA
jgi:hypothetical protein